MKKAIFTALLTLIVLFSGFAVLSPGAHAAIPIRATPPVPDLSGLTEKYNWTTTADPTGLTIQKSNGVSYSYVTFEGRNAVKIDMYNVSDVYHTEYFNLNLPTSPGVYTASFSVYIPEQTGIPDNEQDTTIVLSFEGGSGYIHVKNSYKDDVVEIWNGTDPHTTWTIPRMPRNTWLHFIYSVEFTDAIHFYVYVHGGNYTLSESYIKPLSANGNSNNYFNIHFTAAAYNIQETLYASDFHYYAESYSLPDYEPPFENSPVYYKGWDWKNHVWVWERQFSDWGDADITHDGNITLNDYLQNFTVFNAVAQINDEKQINETLNNTGLKSIILNVGYAPTPTYYPLFRAVSWASAHDSRIKAVFFDDYSSNIQLANYNTSQYEAAIQQLHTYNNNLKVYGLVYTHNYQVLNSTAWNILDGVVISGWDAEDYTTAIDTLISVASSYYDSSDIYVLHYTHWYGNHEGASATEQHRLFEKYHDLITQGKIAGVIAIGPARFLDYTDDDYPYTEEANEYFAKQMMLSYSSDGKTITLYKEWDGKYLNFSRIVIPKLADSDSYAIVSHANIQIELEIPEDWSYNSITVRDLTTGRSVSWQRGSVIFTTVDGHTYVIKDTIQESLDLGLGLFNAALGAMMVMAVVTMIFAALGNMSKKMQKTFKFD